jgi:hypothetical protein
VNEHREHYDHVHVSLGGSEPAVEDHVHNVLADLTSRVRVLGSGALLLKTSDLDNQPGVWLLVVETMVTAGGIKFFELTGWIGSLRTYTSPSERRAYDHLGIARASVEATMRSFMAAPWLDFLTEPAQTERHDDAGQPTERWVFKAQALVRDRNQAP